MSKEDMTDTDGWVTINLDDNDDDNESDIEIVSDDDEDDDEDVEDAHNKTKSGETDTDAEDDQEDGGQEETDEAEEKAKVKHKSRAQDRIRQLANEKNQYKKQLEELQNKYADLETQSVQTQKVHITSQKESITGQIQALKGQLRQAIENADVDAEMEIQDKLQDLKVDLRVLDAQDKRLPADTNKKQKQDNKDSTNTNVLNELPQPMVTWLSNNEWAADPIDEEEERKVKAVRRLARTLTREGFDEHDEEFYDELDARLEKQFGKSDTDSVDYKNKDTSSHSTETAQQKKKSVNKQTTGGSSRTPASKQSKKYRISEQEKRLAERINGSVERYAKRKKAIEDANGGWVTID